MNRTLYNVILSVSLTSQISVTLTLYPFGNFTRRGNGSVVMLKKLFLVKVIWCVAPESSIHKSFLDFRQPRESILKSVDE